MSEKQITKRQHYVPQTYLQGFSLDGKRLYAYYIKKAEAIGNAVPIDSVCYEDYLYEFRDSGGQIVSINLLEDSLCNYEGMFADYKRKLEEKAYCKENFETMCFLTKEEKDFWMVYLTLQILRNPIILNGTAEIVKSELPESDITEARNYALAISLPLVKKAEPGDMNAFIYFLSLVNRKKLTIGYTENDHLFTSDLAVYGYSPTKGEFDFESLWFPINSKLVLIASDPNKISPSMYNRLIPLSDEEVKNLNKGIAYNANQMIFSKYPFTEDDIRLIEQARAEKAQDEKNEN